MRGGETGGKSPAKRASSSITHSAASRPQETGVREDEQAGTEELGGAGED